jgi:hypothetical protein
VSVACGVAIGAFAGFVLAGVIIVVYIRNTWWDSWT